MNRTITIFAFVVIILSAACSICPPCVPVHEIVVKKVPVYSCPEPAVLPAVVLPAWAAPPEDPAPDPLKEWYVSMQATVKARESVLVDDGKTCREYLDAYREPEQQDSTNQ